MFRHVMYLYLNILIYSANAVLLIDQIIPFATGLYQLRDNISKMPKIVSEDRLMLIVLLYIEKKYFVAIFPKGVW